MFLTAQRNLATSPVLWEILPVAGMSNLIMHSGTQKITTECVQGPSAPTVRRTELKTTLITSVSPY